MAKAGEIGGASAPPAPAFSRLSTACSWPARGGDTTSDAMQVAIKVAASGLQAQSRRMLIVSKTLANANSTGKHSRRRSLHAKDRRLRRPSRRYEQARRSSTPTGSIRIASRSASTQGTRSSRGGCRRQRQDAERGFSGRALEDMRQKQTGPGAAPSGRQSGSLDDFHDHRSLEELIMLSGVSRAIFCADARHRARCSGACSFERCDGRRCTTVHSHRAAIAGFWHRSRPDGHGCDRQGQRRVNRRLLPVFAVRRLRSRWSRP